MRRVAGQISYRAVRNHGTIGGSVALADPAADWPGCLMALDAIVRDRRTETACACEPVADFIQGPYETSLTPARSSWASTSRVRARRCTGVSPRSRARAAHSPIRSRSSTAQGRERPGVGGARRRGRRARSSSRPSPTSSGPARRPDDAARGHCGGTRPRMSPDADDYQKRMHTATILRAIREMRAQ